MVLNAQGPGASTAPGPLVRTPTQEEVHMPPHFPPVDKFDDDDYPAYTMGRAADMLGTTPAFLRASARPA